MSQLFLKFVFVLIIYLQSINCLGVGSCAKVSTVEKFDPKKYAGKWYEIRRGPKSDTSFENGLKCVTAEYKIIDSTKLTVINGGIKIKGGKHSQTVGSAIIKNTSEPAKLVVKFSFASGLVKTSGNYWVIDTDYENYSLVYSCKTYIGFIKTEAIWILSRTRTIKQAHYDKLIAKIESFAKKLVPKLIVQDQTNCPNN